MPFSIFKKKSKEEEFWNWILKNKSALEEFVFSDQKDESIYHALTREMKKYHHFLFPEMTVSDKKEVVLIITPDGMRDGLIPTQKLYESKPELNNWLVKKFRQASDEVSLVFDGISYPSSDIEIMPELDMEQEKVNVRIFIRNMNSEPNKYKSLAFLYLDHILGEFNTITKVGYIDFYHLDDGQAVADSISVLALRKLIEKQLYLADI